MLPKSCGDQDTKNIIKYNIERPEVLEKTSCGEIVDMTEPGEIAEKTQANILLSKRLLNYTFALSGSLEITQLLW